MFLKKEKKYSSLREEFVSDLNRRFEEERKKRLEQGKDKDRKIVKKQSSFF